MPDVLSSLRQRRDELIERGSQWADATRLRGLDALDRVRDGALGAKRTLAEHRARLDGGRWLRVEVRVIGGVERLLSIVAERAGAQMKRLGPRPSTAASRQLVMPIAGYDELTAKQVIAEVPGLTEAQCRVVLEHERAHKSRKTVLRALESRIG